MAYTPFTLLAASIMVAMAFTSINTVDTDQIRPEKTDTLEQGWEITQTNYAVDSLAVFTDLETGSHTKNDVERALVNLTDTGVYNSNRERTSTVSNATESIESQFSYVENLDIKDLEVSISNLTLITGSSTQIVFDNSEKTVEARNSQKITGVDDPLLQGTSYSRSIDACSFNSLADKIYTGNNSQGTVRGEAVVEPSSPSSESSKSSKIVVTSNITQYSNTDIDDFLGYFSEKEPSSPGDYNTNYTVGTSSTPKLEEGQRVIIHNGLWESNFYEAIPENCYMPSPLKETPSIYDRINESTRGNTEQGVYTLLNPSPSESDVAYQRLDNSSINPVEIRTVSETNAWPDFRIGRDLAEATGLTGLIK